MAHELEVWLSADRVGTLALVEGRLNFCYEADWLSHKEAVALSVGLPLQAAPFDDRKTRPFFAGLLPEGQMRRLIAQQFQVSGQNDFALLDRIGGECAGAVTFLEPGQALPTAAGGNDVHWLNDDEVVAILDELPHRPMLAGKDGLRLSLAGAQDKLPVVFDGARIGLARNGTPSSHILKPAIRSVEDSVINEGFCMALAQAMQLKPANSKVHRVLDRSFLLVERYDRLRLLDCVIFNALIGNHDAHAKNLSLLYSGKTAVLAPFYDLLSTAVYPALTPKMAMKIGSKYKFTEVQARHWEQFAEGIGMTKAQVKQRVVKLAKVLPVTARKLQSAPERGFAKNAVVEQINALIEQRCALTVRRLTDTAGEIDALAKPVD